jgi:hypothetical protein
MGFQAHGWRHAFPALCAMYAGDYAECIGYIDAALEATRANDDRVDLAMTRAIVGGCLSGWCQHRRASTHLRDARRLSETTGVRIAVATACMVGALTPGLATGSMSLDELVTSMERFEQTAFGFQRPSLEALRAHMLFRSGDLPGALVALQAGYDLNVQNGMIAGRATGLLGQAEVLIAMHGGKAHEDVERLLATAREFMDANGTPVFLPQIHVVRAMLAAASDDHATAARERELAIGLYREMGAPLPDDLSDADARGAD